MKCTSFRDLFGTSIWKRGYVRLHKVPSAHIFISKINLFEKLKPESLFCVSISDFIPNIEGGIEKKRLVEIVGFVRKRAESYRIWASSSYRASRRRDASSCCHVNRRTRGVSTFAFAAEARCLGKKKIFFPPFEEEKRQIRIFRAFRIGLMVRSWKGQSKSRSGEGGGGFLQATKWNRAEDKNLRNTDCGVRYETLRMARVE